MSWYGPVKMDDLMARHEQICCPPGTQTLSTCHNEMDLLMIWMYRNLVMVPCLDRGCLQVGFMLVTMCRCSMLWSQHLPAVSSATATWIYHLSCWFHGKIDWKVRTFDPPWIARSHHAGCLCLAKAMKTVAFGPGPEKRATRSQKIYLFLGSGKKDFVVRETWARGNYEEGCYSSRNVVQCSEPILWVDLSDRSASKTSV